METELSAGRRIGLALAAVWTAVALLFWHGVLQFANCHWGLFGEYGPRTGHESIDQGDIVLLLVWLGITAVPLGLVAVASTHQPSRRGARLAVGVAVAIVLAIAARPYLNSAAYWTLDTCR